MPLSALIPEPVNTTKCGAEVMLSSAYVVR